MNRRLVAIAIWIFLTGAFLVNSALAEEPDYQNVLLTFYTQQLVAHGATLFAATTAAFTFITRLNPNQNKKALASAIVFIAFSGILLGIVFYIGFRMIWYGALTHGVIRFQPSMNLAEYPSAHDSLAEYHEAVCGYTLSTGNWFWVSILKVFQSSLQVSGPSISLYLGLLLALPFYYAFKKNSLETRDVMFLLFCLVCPVLYWFGLVLVTDARKLGAELFVIWWIWYIIFPAFYWWRARCLQKRKEAKVD